MGVLGGWGDPVGCWAGGLMGGFGWEKINFLRGIFVSSSSIDLCFNFSGIFIDVIIPPKLKGKIKEMKMIFLRIFKEKDRLFNFPYVLIIIEMLKKNERKIDLAQVKKP